MIKKWNEYIKEDFDGSESLIDAKMQEISDLVSSIAQSQSQGQAQSKSQSLIYEWENKNDHDLIVNFTKDDLAIKYEFSIDNLYVTKYAGDVVDFEKSVDSIDEGLDIIEKDIQYILDINESNRIETFSSFNEKKSEKYKGHKIPGKYLTRKKGAMKKEIDTFRGKKEYKKDWEADVDKRSGKRIKTKKSAATKAYQKMFGK
jgi:hypothetical protein